MGETTASLHHTPHVMSLLRLRCIIHWKQKHGDVGGSFLEWERWRWSYDGRERFFTDRRSSFVRGCGVNVATVIVLKHGLSVLYKPRNTSSFHSLRNCHEQSGTRYCSKPAQTHRLLLKSTLSQPISRNGSTRLFHSRRN
jgi:hypothetical protein